MSPPPKFGSPCHFAPRMVWRQRKQKISLCTLHAEEWCSYHWWVPTTVSLGKPDNLATPPRAGPRARSPLIRIPGFPNLFGGSPVNPQKAGERDSYWSNIVASGESGPQVPGLHRKKLWDCVQGTTHILGTPLFLYQSIWKWLSEERLHLWKYGSLACRPSF